MTDRTTKARKVLKDVSTGLQRDGFVTKQMMWDMVLALGIIIDELEEVRSND